MRIATQHQKIALLGSIVIIGLLIASFVLRSNRQHTPPSSAFSTNSLDQAVGVVAAEEARRVGGGSANVVLLFNAHENAQGTEAERSAQDYAAGFLRGTLDDQGKPRSDIALLANKYKADDPNADPYRDWPTLAVLQQIVRDQPQCNVVVSFCGRLEISPAERGGYDPNRLPRLIIVNSLTDDPDRWRAMFETGLVEVLFAGRPRTPAVLQSAQQMKDPRQIVGTFYWLLSRDNLEAGIQKATGR